MAFACFVFTRTVLPTVVTSPEDREGSGAIVRASSLAVSFLLDLRHLGTLCFWICITVKCGHCWNHSRGVKV
jgi:hypothetical protein